MKNSSTTQVSKPTVKDLLGDMASKIANPRLIKITSKTINDNADYLVVNMNLVKDYVTAVTELAIYFNPDRWGASIPSSLEKRCKLEFVDDSLGLSELGISSDRLDLGKEILTDLNAVTLCNFSEDELNSDEFKNLIKTYKEYKYFY